jgi:glutaredoxin
MKRTFLALAVPALLAATAPLDGCSRKKPDDGTTPVAGRTLPPLTLKDDTPDLMLTWLDDKGDTHVELRIPDVPAAGRSMVRVVVSDREDGTRDLFYVADLTKKRDDGAYETRTVPRREWEGEIEKRRDAYLARTAPPRPPPAGSAAGRDRPAPAQQAGPAAVIIYGASWCGPCHQAADYLRSKGVPYVLKDVEETPGAAAEMREKLARAGRHGGSIPVIDVRGNILVGFSAAAIDQALARVPAGTTL